MRMLSALLVSMMAMGCAGEWTAEDEHPGNPTPGTGGDSSGSSQTGGIDEITPEPTCSPGSTRDCYGGPWQTAGIGACKSGTQTCLEDGTAWEPCHGENLPAAELCQTPEDDDCDGVANEDCVCSPGDLRSCYTGPAGTDGIGICKRGMSVCAWDGKDWLPCYGEITPEPAELCETPEDEDCNGTSDDESAACPENTTCQDHQCISHCQLHGVLDCPSGICTAKFICGSQGGPLDCAYVWTCVP